MNDASLITLISTSMTLLLLAAISAIVFKRIRFSYTIGLVIVGIIAGIVAQNVEALKVFQHLRLTPNTILYIILPTLVFDAALNIDSRLLLKNLSPVLVLAGPGLLISTLIVGGLVALLTPLTLGPAMLFGALISATDPVAVIALFKEIGAPKRLTMLVDGESLFNDATAIVMFQIVMGIIVAGGFGAAVLLKGTWDFIFVFAGGTLVGALIGFIMMSIISLAKDDPLIETALSMVVAYAAFIAANYYLNVSGVMSVVGAGIVINWFGTTRFTPEVRQYLRHFWGYASFVANSFIFLLLGFTEHFLKQGFTPVQGILGFLFFTIAAVTIARVVVVYGLVPVLNHMPNAQRIDLKNQTIIFWGGLRGAIPIALCLSLAPDFPFRQLIVELTLGVVLFTIFVQGLTIRPLMHWFGLDKLDLLQETAQLKTVQAARHKGIERIATLKETGFFAAEAVSKAEGEYREMIGKADSDIARLGSDGHSDDAQTQILWSEALSVEQRVYNTMFTNGIISEIIMFDLRASIERRRDMIKNGNTPPPLPAGRPASARLANAAITKLARAFPRSTIAQRHRLRLLANSFEKEIAFLCACKQVRKELHHIAGIFSAPANVEQEIEKFYEQLSNAAAKRLDSMKEVFPEYIMAAEEWTLKRAALASEKKLIGEVAGNDGISEAASQALIEDIENTLKALRAEQEKELASDPARFLQRRKRL